MQIVRPRAPNPTLPFDEEKSGMDTFLVQFRSYLQALIEITRVVAEILNFLDSLVESLVVVRALRRNGSNGT